MSNLELNEIKDINSLGHQLGLSSPQKIPIEKKLSKKSKIVIGLSIGFLIAGIIIIIIVLAVEKKINLEI